MEPPTNLNEPVFFFTHHWELMWLYPIIKKTGWPIIYVSDTIQQICDDLGFKTITEEEAQSHTKLIITVQHFTPQRERVDHWTATGGQVYVIQHAWDSILALQDEFWSAHMNSFTKMLVCCTQDDEWLSQKYRGKIFLTGSPRLAMINEVKIMDLSDIYEKVGTKDFFVATPPLGGFHSDTVYNMFYRDLPTLTQSKIVYKIHPSGDLNGLKAQYPQFFFWQDSRTDPYDTYKLVMASHGLVTASSFLGIEATLMDKPVILMGDLMEEEYQRQEWQHQRERLPRDISSTLAKPEITSKQKEVKNWYKYDDTSLDNVIKEVLE